LAGFYPVRAAYSYLLRLHRFGLLERHSSALAVYYRLSERGKFRLAWLERLLGPVK
jgi:DNA-binding transcriptional regulator PaaX